jgi:hypothetical protein
VVSQEGFRSVELVIMFLARYESSLLLGRYFFVYMDFVTAVVNKSGQEENSYIQTLETV